MIDLASDELYTPEDLYDMVSLKSKNSKESVDLIQQGIPSISPTWSIYMLSKYHNIVVPFSIYYTKEKLFMRIPPVRQGKDPETDKYFFEIKGRSLTVKFKRHNMFKNGNSFLQYCFALCYQIGIESVEIFDMATVLCPDGKTTASISPVKILAGGIGYYNKFGIPLDQNVRNMGNTIGNLTIREVYPEYKGLFNPDLEIKDAAILTQNTEFCGELDEILHKSENRLVDNFLFGIQHMKKYFGPQDKLY